MSPWVTTRSAEPTSPALGRWSGGRGGAHLSFLLFLREGGLSPCGNQGWEGIVGSMCPACKPGLGPSHSPAWRPGSLPSCTPGRGGVSGSLCSQELASELLLMGTAFHALLEACGMGVLTAGLPVGFWLQVGQGRATRTRWVVLGAEKLEGGEPGGRPSEQGPGRASRGKQGERSTAAGTPSHVGVGRNGEGIPWPACVSGATWTQACLGRACARCDQRGLTL